MYVVYAVLAVIGAVLFFIGTGMVGNETVYDDQVPGINLAIVGRRRRQRGRASCSCWPVAVR